MTTLGWLHSGKHGAVKNWVATDGGWRSETRRVSDNLTIPAGETWRLTDVEITGTVVVEPGARLVAAGCTIGRLQVATGSGVELTACTVIRDIIARPSRPVRTPEAIELVSVQVCGDIRVVGRSDQPQSRLSLRRSTRVGGCVLLAGVDLDTDETQQTGAIWRTDAAAQPERDNLITLPEAASRTRRHEKDLRHSVAKLAELG
ncbi:MAG: hypothetical protein CSA58_01040 [Micrococcales bacterium]|nr:MAG: hypothetical protein CSB46_02610 [Micrococcales bacterium]PIE28068.1 MAG: hypothetical protein CSA58_01040 [Micrococcales bacterium]